MNSILLVLYHLYSPERNFIYHWQSMWKFY